jgi:hypothetical protein
MNELSGKKLKVYCKICDQLICMDFKHVKQGHSCVLVKDVANNHQELITSNNKAMEVNYYITIDDKMMK